MNTIQSNIKEIQDKIGHCKLIAVSKRQSEEKILEAYEAGIRDFGENYVQELVDKYQNLPKDIQWHMIGHLQTNKVKYIAPFVSLIHSVDSIKLLKEINKQAQKSDRIINCLLQIHIAQEETKTGFDEEEIMSAIEADFSQYQNVRIIGLMGMSTFTSDKEEVVKEFKNLQQLFERINQKAPALSLKELSMGMSGDWPEAIDNGSTMIRVGSSIFGNRL